MRPRDGRRGRAPERRGWGVNRFPLATLPTPLIRARRLEAAIHSPPLYIKRDDLIGFALAGNKARKLELLVADARAGGCDTLVTGGGPDSNHCQATAAAARVAGLGCCLILYGDEASPGLYPNLGLARAFGAEIRFTGDPERTSVDRAIAAAERELADEGRKPYVIPRGGATPLGAVGFALAVEELAGQLRAADVEPETIVLATGSCGTQAGLVAGTVAGGYGWTVIGASVSRPVEECRERVLRLARGCAALLGVPAAGEERVHVRDARGPGYGLASAAGREAAGLMARTEGVLLDPIYTGKAFGLLLSLLDDGLAGPIVFWHTGGIPAAVGAALGGEKD
ncbi:MAG: pyridoxal-phosphate dependent enzyme [Chloroflexi bacterium]|nr:pyridoxal-phosphate dependent enzyme [Chloroflexota bacterium]